MIDKSIFGLSHCLIRTQKNMPNGPYTPKHKRISRRELKTVHVDPTQPTVYSPRVKSALFASLDTSGHGSFNVDELRQWSYEHSLHGTPPLVAEVLDHIQEKGIASSFLGLREGEAISKQARLAFKDRFGREGNGHTRALRLYLWRSVVTDRKGVFYVPYLSADLVSINVCWVKVAYERWTPQSFGLQFPVAS